MEIVKWPDPILTSVCKAIDIGSIDDSLLDAMRDGYELMCRLKGVGLAAPQIGIPLRFFFVWNGVFLNPAITDRSPEENIKDEGCLSLPEQSFSISRPNWIKVQYQDLAHTIHTEILKDDRARVWCHEQDHLDGLLINRFSNPQKSGFIVPEIERKIRRRWIKKYANVW